MKLRAYLDGRDISNGAFGDLIGRTAEAVRRYAAGERIPDKETMPLIVEHTNGHVQPNDFFELPDTPPPFLPSCHGTVQTAPGTEATPNTPVWGLTERSARSAHSSDLATTRPDRPVAA